jgi:hypothetical protein
MIDHQNVRHFFRRIHPYSRICWDRVEVSNSVCNGMFLFSPICIYIYIGISNGRTWVTLVTLVGLLIHPPNDDCTHNKLNREPSEHGTNLANHLGQHLAFDFVV